MAVAAGALGASPAGSVATAAAAPRAVITTAPAADAAAPAIVVSDQSSIAGTPITPYVVALDDPAATVTVSGLPPGLRFDQGTRDISGTPMTAGLYAVTVTAVDAAGNTSSASFTWLVVDRTAPVVDAIADQTVPLGSPIAPVEVRVDDPGATVSVVGLPDGVDHTGWPVRITGTPTTPGTYPVIVTAMDPAGNMTDETFTITVTASDTVAPTVHVTDQKARLGVAIVPFDILVDDPTATTVVTGLPAGLARDPVTGTVTGTPTAAGYYTVDVTATDPAGNIGRATFMYWVGGNWPAVQPIPDQTVVAGSPIENVSIRATDPLPAIFVSGLPDGVVFNREPPELYGTPTTPGVYRVVVTTVGTYMEPGATSFTITVTPRPTPTPTPAPTLPPTSSSTALPTPTASPTTVAPPSPPPPPSATATSTAHEPPLGHTETSRTTTDVSRTSRRVVRPGEPPEVGRPVATQDSAPTADRTASNGQPLAATGLAVAPLSATAFALMASGIGLGLLTRRRHER